MSILSKIIFLGIVVVLLCSCKKKETDNTPNAENTSTALQQGNYDLMEYRHLPDGSFDIYHRIVAGPNKPANLNQYRFSVDSAGYIFNYKFDLSTNIGIIEIVDSVQFTYDIIQQSATTTQFTVYMMGTNNVYETSVVLYKVP